MSELMKFTERVMAVSEGSEFEISKEQALKFIEALPLENMKIGFELADTGQCRFLGRVLVVKGCENSQYRPTARF